MHTMTPSEFAAAMLKLEQNIELSTGPKHEAQDDLMCQLLTALGYEDGVQVYLKGERWFS